MEYDEENTNSQALPPAIESHYDEGNVRLSQSNSSVAPPNSAVWRSHFDSAEEEICTDSKDYEIHIEARKKAIEFEIAQYGRYLRNVEESRFNPKQLITGLEIASDGSNQPPSEFFSLTTVRDRLIIQSSSLIRCTRYGRDEATNHLKISALLALLIAAALHAVPDRRVDLLNIPIFVYVSFVARGIAKRYRYERQLKSVIKRATNWDPISK
ncbi:hypothetical protein N7528_009772 [Penicillium herquei]|nr:hypothetical protein N7528_009772 [Penicillium herquei]